jgi:sec-independent protein translocase protein TatB
MFDFSWAEIAVIAAVALIAIGPKDMPVAIRAMTGWLKKARRMASEFQTHVDEMVREANLEEVRDQINEIRNFNVKSMVEETVDPDHSLRDTFIGNPLEPTPVARTVAADGAGDKSSDAAVAELDRPQEAATSAAAAQGEAEAPAFIPPALAASVPETNAQPEAPAFIPPAIARHRGSHAAL